MGFIVRLAPLGVLGAIAFTVGKYGVGSLAQLGMLVLIFYLSCVVFVLLVLGTVMRLAGFSIFKFLALHPRGADDRPRHRLLRQRAAAAHAQARAARRRRVAPSASSSRPATRSTSTASRST